MLSYQRILIALDVFAVYQPVLDKGLELANKDTEVSLIYATIPHVHLEPYGAAFEADFIEDIKKQSKDRLQQIAKQHGIPAERAHFALGYAAEEIQSYAEKIKADVIVIGTHGRKGLKLLLGSTANGVLHGVKQDVLAVKI